MTVLRGAARTDIGRVRSVNQDGALTSPFLVAVADGMGGHRAGEVASALALRSMASHERFATLNEVVDAVQRANGAIFEAAAKEPDLRGMGTTLCAMALVDSQGPRDRLALVNVGDSRAYQVVDGDLAQLTVDHSLVQLMVQEGQLRPDEAESHPQRNILTRALGIEASVAVDGWQLDAVPGDRFLICSDGLFNEVEPGRIAATLRAYADPGEAARVLVGLANAAGGRDNVTCVVVDVVDAAEPGEAEGGGEVTGAGAGADAGSAASRGGGAPGATSSAPANREPGRRATRRRSTVATAEHPVVRTTGDDTTGPTGADDPTTTMSASAVTVPVARRRTETGADTVRNDEVDRTAPERTPPRRLTLRVVLFLFTALAVLAVAVLAVGWFATRTYFVAFDDDGGGGQVTIFRGRPGGLLWIDPTVAEAVQPPLRRADLVEALCSRVEGQPSATDLGDARRIVEQLRADQTALPAPTSPCGAAR